ncbi:hypothetical protein BDP27DRAFT_1359796 [Rhodocollybia butyracea]|uniref:ArsA/GET3 Anion-transporting ATPase-like domain-containing protein n=1 Tax=Rhodocollybia butyracea TaxID=206335 RepID=A0A9P5UBA7_9AGAR|nr:hypothetical protein BDP27DRAFT_1359796 [Rhodocollybia butyracea]
MVASLGFYLSLRTLSLRSPSFQSTDPAHNLSDTFEQKFPKERLFVNGFTKYGNQPDEFNSEDVDSNGMMGSMMQDLAFAIPDVDEAMSFAEDTKHVKSMIYPALRFHTVLEKGARKAQRVGGEVRWDDWAGRYVYETESTREVSIVEGGETSVELNGGLHDAIIKQLSNRATFEESARAAVFGTKFKLVNLALVLYLAVILYIPLSSTSSSETLVDDSDPRISYLGIGVQVYGTVGDAVPQSQPGSGSPASTYQVDDLPTSLFVFPGNNQNNYGIQFYASPLLDPGNHTLLITALGNNGSELWLDYIVYFSALDSSTNESVPNSSETPSPPASSSSPKSGSTATNTTHKTSPKVEIISGVLGSVMGFFLVLVLAYIIRRRRNTLRSRYPSPFYSWIKILNARGLPQPGRLIERSALYKSALLESLRAVLIFSGKIL